MQHTDHNDDENKNLCWLDLETTGLAEDTDAILELGIVITDP
jgi:oligoribonuclease (3'-5' exoribonuclease)